MSQADLVGCEVEDDRGRAGEGEKRVRKKDEKE